MVGNRDETSPLLRRDSSTSCIRTQDSAQDSCSSQFLEGRQLYIALVLPNLAMLLAAIDVTLTATLSAKIASSLDSLSIISWLGTAYLVATSATQPLSGKLSDRFGRRNCFIISLSLFSIGNLLCGIAQSTIAMICGRVIAGAGGGAMGSITTFIISDLVSLRDQPLWQGLGNCLWAAGTGLGSVMGGVVNDLVGWRWTFIGLAPLSILIAVGSIFTLPSGSHIVHESKHEPIDYFGATTFTGALVALVLGLNIADHGDSMTIPLLMLATATVFLICSAIWEINHAEAPMMPLRSLANRTVAAACVSSLFVSAAADIVVFYAPIQIQARGYSTTETGLQLLGQPVGAILGSIGAGWTMRAAGDYSVVKPISFLIMLASPTGFFFSKLSTPVWIVELCLISMEAGFGACMSVILTGLLAATDQSAQASTTGMLFAFRQVGASSSLALAGILLRWRLSASGLQSLPLTASNHEGSTDRKRVADLGKVCDRHLRKGNSTPPLCVAYHHALHVVFLSAVIIAIMALIAGMFIRNKSLERERGEERKGIAAMPNVSQLSSA